MALNPLYLAGKRFYSTSTENKLKPVAFYLNADTDKVNIIENNRGKSGVYRWTNKLNGNSYIGGSTDLSRRFANYYNYNKIIKSNMNINKAILKYGYSHFSLEILEYCKPNNILTREQYYLDLYKPIYNILKKAGSSLGYRHTYETKAFISSIKTGKTGIKKIGVKHTEETKLKISKSLVGRKLSKETISKMIGRGGKKVQITDITTNVVIEFVSMRQAALFLETSLDTVRKYIINKKIFNTKYKITIKEE